MLGTLIESGATRTRKPAASLFSVSVHAGLITAAVMATQQMRSVVPETTTPDVVYRVQATPPPPEAPAPVTAPLPRGFSVLIAPITIPDVLPTIDLTRAITDPAAFTGVGVAGGVPDGVVVPPGDVFTADQVERVAQVVDGTAMAKYPESLRSARIEGDVILEFVIEADGRPDPRSIRVVSSNHRQFADAALRALAKARFVPAEFGGRKVAQLVRMPFAFKLRT